MAGEARGAGLVARLKLTPQEGAAAKLEVELNYLAARRVDHERIALTLPGQGWALGRDLQWTRLVSPLRIDRGTPGVALVRPRGGVGVVVTAGRGVVAALYTPRPEADAVDVVLVLDDAASRPFTTYEHCGTAWDPADEVHREAHRAIARAAGEVLRGEAMLCLLDPGVDFTPLIVERWPEGREAAVVFTDHADRTDPRALRAVLYGASDAALPGYGKAGFFGHGLKLTKTFFLFGGVGTLEGDAEAAILADEIVAAGSEVGSHSITGHADSCEAVKRGLPAYARLSAVTWIDHQPDTNCEALANLGWSDDARYAIHALLAAAGFRWVWSASDVASGESGWLHNLYVPEHASEAAPPIYPLPSDPRLWVFRASWFYEPPRVLAAAMSEAALGKLERERGLFVGHCYLSASPRTTKNEEHNRRNLVHVAGDGSMRLDPAFDAALARLAHHVTDGRLASLTWREAGDRLLALADVEVTYFGDGSARIHNRGMAAVSGLTVAVPAKGVKLTITGAPLGGERHDEGRATAWFDLPAGAVVTLSSSPAGFARGGKLTVEVAP